MLNRIAELVEREGGRVLLAFTLLIVGGAWAALHLPKADDVISGALTLIARELVGAVVAKKAE